MSELQKYTGPLEEIEERSGLTLDQRFVELLIPLLPMVSELSFSQSSDELPELSVVIRPNWGDLRIDLSMITDPNSDFRRFVKDLTYSIENDMTDSTFDYGGCGMCHPSRHPATTTDRYPATKSMGGRDFHEIELTFKSTIFVEPNNTKSCNKVATS